MKPERPQYKIAVAGLARAGKTSVVKRLLTGRFEQTESTKGFNTEIFEHSSIKFQVVDLGGQDVFVHTLWKAFLPQADVLVYVVDANDTETFEKARDVLHFALSWNPNLPFLMILANKQDLPTAVTAEELLERFNMTTILAENNIQTLRIFATSAKSGEGINESFTWMATQLTGQKSVPVVNIRGAHLLKRNSTQYQTKGKNATEIAHISFMTPDEEITVGSSVYSAIDNFINGILEGQINTLEISGYSGERYKLVNIERDDLCCVLVTDIQGEMTVIKAVGNELLDYVIQQETKQLQVENESIRGIIEPFLPDSDAKTAAEEDFTTATPEKKTVTETVQERDRYYVKSQYKRGDTQFFTKMSVLDRIRTLED
ncbi:MAG: ADP-ribosylation factor family protein [Candidatus Odinarchaeota archaeon]